MKKILFIGLLAFLAAAIWQFPLSYAKPYAEKFVRGLKIEGPSGTIWNGEAKNLIANNTNFEQVKWNVKPVESITSLSLKFDFDIQGRELSANGLAGITPNKTLIIDNTQFDLNANYINKQQKFARLTGDIKGNIKHAELNQNDLPIIDGIIDWKEAAISSPIKLAKGDYNAIITQESNLMNIQLSSSDAPVELSGKITLNKDWNYDTDLNIKATDPNIDLEPMIIPFFTFFLKLDIKDVKVNKQANGAVNIKQKGDLKPFIGR